MEVKREREISTGPVALAADRDIPPVDAVASVWNRPALWIAFLLLLLVVIAFWPTLENGFVNWDDEKNFVRNAHFQGLGPRQLYWAWTTYWVGVYQPLAWMLFEAQYVTFGLNPRGFHLVSILFHAVNSVVLFALTLTLLNRALPEWYQEHPTRCSVSAGLATALFAIHPLRTEAVAWASCQPYLPCAFFYWLALLFYLRAFPESGLIVRRWFWIAFVCFTGALLSKAVAVSLPLVLLLLDAYPLKRIQFNAAGQFARGLFAVCVEKIPFFALSALFMLLALASKPHDPLIPITNVPGLWLVRWVRAAYGIWFYLGKTVWPFALTAFYAAPKGTSPLELRFVASIAATIAVTVTAFRLRRSHPAILVAWLSYVMILFPNLGVVSISRQLAADRYSYVAMVGLVALFAGTLCSNGLSSPIRAGRAVAYTMATMALFGVLITLSWAQCRTWRSSELLWTHALNHGGERLPDVQNSLGLSVLEQGKVEDARWHFREAIRLEPRYGEPHNNLGSIFGRLGEFSEAKSEFVESIRLTPTDPTAYNNLGTIFLGEGNVEGAIRQFITAVRLDPDDSSVTRLNDVLMFHRSKVTPQVGSLIRAVVANPRDRTALQELERALAAPDR